MPDVEVALQVVGVQSGHRQPSLVAPVRPLDMEHTDAAPQRYSWATLSISRQRLNRAWDLARAAVDRVRVGNPNAVRLGPSVEAEAGAVTFSPALGDGLELLGAPQVGACGSAVARRGPGRSPSDYEHH